MGFFFGTVFANALPQTECGTSVTLCVFSSPALGKEKI
jgi:hypothetical protein